MNKAQTNLAIVFTPVLSNSKINVLSEEKMLLRYVATELVDVSLIISLQNLGFSNLSTGSKVAILISICVIYRIACWGVLRVKHQ